MHSQRSGQSNEADCFEARCNFNKIVAALPCETGQRWRRSESGVVGNAFVQLGTAINCVAELDQAHICAAKVALQ